MCESKKYDALSEAYGQCWSVTCGIRSVRTIDWPLTAQALEKLYVVAHQELLHTSPAIEAAHPAVVAHSMIGLLSTDAIDDVYGLFVQRAAEAVKECEAALEGRKGRPPSELIFAVQHAKEVLNRVKVTSVQLRKAATAAPLSVCHFWTDAEHQIVRLTIAGVSVGEGGVFNHAMRGGRFLSQSTEALRTRFLGVPSPDDVLLLQSTAAQLAEQEGEPPEAGYVWCGAIECPKSVRRISRMPLLFVPNTASGNRLALQVRQMANLHVFHTPERHGVAEWLRKISDPQKRWDAILRQRKSKRLMTRPFEAVRAQLDDIRAAEGSGFKRFQVERWVADEVVADLNERGTVYFDGQMPYMFQHDTQDVTPIDPEVDDWKVLANSYGVAPADGIAKPLVHHGYVAALKDGVKAEVYPFVHFDRTRKAVYVFDLNKTVYRVRNDAIDTVPNGTDGHLFVRNAKWQPFTLQLGAKVLPRVPDVLCGGLRFTSERVTSEELKHLLHIWLVAMFFPELFPTRPILALVGPKGSAKTTVLDLIGKMLFGASFKVAQLTADARDLDAALTSEYYVVIDNADQDYKWLPDKLAVVATGGKIKRRLYYTTNTLVEFPLKAWVGITSRTPQFRREDVADRLLPITLDRLTSFKGFDELQIEVQRDRDLLMTALVRNAQTALRLLCAKDTSKFQTSFRMADYARFAHAVSRGLGIRRDVEDLLRRLAAEQIAFTLDGDPLFEAIETWMDRTSSHGREITTGKLFEELCDLVPLLMAGIRTPQQFGQRLEDCRATLQTVYAIKTRVGRAGTKWIRLHRLTSGDDGDAP